MERKIKFRVWTGNKLVSWDDTLSSQVKIPSENGPETLFPLLIAAFLIDGHSNIAADQYTNLNDKNDKEIYEGDIIKYKGLEYFVEYTKNGYDAWMPSMESNNSKIFLGDLWEKVKDIEVVDNVHERIPEDKKVVVNV